MNNPTMKHLTSLPSHGSMVPACWLWCVALQTDQPCAVHTLTVSCSLSLSGTNNSAPCYPETWTHFTSTSTNSKELVNQTQTIKMLTMIHPMLQIPRLCVMAQKWRWWWSCWIQRDGVDAGAGHKDSGLGNLFSVGDYNNLDISPVDTWI